jgi:hypothetical protein
MELLSGYSMEELKKLFRSGESYNKGTYPERNGKFINRNIRLGSLDEERFEPHPYLPIQASNCGNIKFNGRLLDQKPLNGYTYVNVPYETVKLVKETNEGKKPENNMATPIIDEAVEYDPNEKHSENDCTGKHPFIYIGVNKNSRIININKYDVHIQQEGNMSVKVPYVKSNFCRPFLERENDGIKYVEIPIYVYRLVAETWLENPDYNTYWIVHHISNNGCDNSIYNLMWVGGEQHKEIQIDNYKPPH